MTIASQRSIGSYIAVCPSILPQSTIAQTINGAAIDRFEHNLPLSCVLYQAVGAASGSPSGMSIQSKLQHSPDDATWTDYLAPGAATVAETPALTSGSASNSVPIELSSACQFIRAVAIISFSGGSSPAIPISVDIVLGGEKRGPAI